MLSGRWLAGVGTAVLVSALLPLEVAADAPAVSPGQLAPGAGPGGGPGRPDAKGGLQGTSASVSTPAASPIPMIQPAKTKATDRVPPQTPVRAARGLDRQ